MAKFFVSFAIVLLPFTLSSPVGAVETEDLEGAWNLAELETPSALRETYFNSVTDQVRTSANSQEFAGPNEILVDAFYPDPLRADLRSFSIDASGSVTGGETGQILSNSQNRILYSDGNELTTVYSNPPGDILLASGRDSDQQSQTLCLKRPPSLTTAELAGTWQVISMINPTNLTAIDFDGRLADTFFAGESRALAGDITIQPNGSFNGLFTGTIAATGPGDATVTTDDSSLSFKFNASKNLAISTLSGDDEQEIITLIRKPAELATSDLEGTWRISAIVIPTTLTESFFDLVTEASRQADSAGIAVGNEVLVDLFHKDQFELNRLQILIDSTGNFTGSVGGSLAATGESVTVSIDGDSISLQPNADKTFMAGIRTSSDSHELIFCIKTSNNRATTLTQEADIKVIPAEGELVLSWNSGSNITLQETNSLGGWDAVDEASGSDAFVIQPESSGAKFFRLTDEP